MLRKIRITLATIFLIGLTLLFLDFTGTAHHWLGWMAKTQAIEAILALNVVVIVLLVVLTLVFGRIYCSVICPLGIMQDIFGWLGKKSKKNRYSYSPEVRWLRYGMLMVMIVAFLAGIGSIVQLLAPYSAFGRIMTFIFQPLWKLGNNVLASIAERADSYAFYSVDVWLKSLPVLIIAIVTLVLLVVLAWRGGRTYCNTICPVGTLLSFISRFSWFRIQFDADKCKSCSLCSKNCKASCIDFKTHHVDASRCVVCGDCISSCKFGALKYAPITKASSHTPQTGNTSKEDKEGKSSRRSFLLATALATSAVIAQDKKVDGGLALIQAKQSPKRLTPITPPGSLSAQNMARRCTGCQLCVSECPNDVLRPSTDMMSLMQPVMEYDRGYCRPECNRCSEVCPAGAIKPIDLEEKSSIQIGHAIVVAKECISAQGTDECGNCARHCPTGAIEMVPSDPNDDLSPSVPAINEAQCIGCGACEYVCPVRPLSAIHVEGHETHKHI
ncbi:MAG: 4Fe-4S binding protein [Prevotella sp.]|nr:4Fe-4S binding protein [Prevotella sp.]